MNWPLLHTLPKRIALRNSHLELSDVANFAEGLGRFFVVSGFVGFAFVVIVSMG